MDGKSAHSVFDTVMHTSDQVPPVVVMRFATESCLHFHYVACCRRNKNKEAMLY
jgi:hypothetical protein